MNIETPIEKCAVLMMAIGEEHAAEIIRHLNPAEVQQMGTAMAGLKAVPRNEVNKVLEEFVEEAGQYTAVTLGSEAFIRDMLNRALGPDRAAGMIEDILDTTASTNGIDTLNSLDPKAINELIAQEHPQIIATILVHLERDRAAGVLSLMPERMRNDIVLRIAKFGGVQPSALHDLTDELNAMLSGHSAKRSKLGGVRTVAELLNTMKGKDESSIIESVRVVDAEMAQMIQEEMFVFDNLIDLESKSIQLILREVDSNVWTLALKGAKPELVNLILSNMSTRQAEMIKEEIADQGPVRLSMVEAEQKKVLDIARRLADEGQITLNNAGDDQYV